jgi:uncharacterized protein (DUF1501 family)
MTTPAAHAPPPLSKSAARYHVSRRQLLEIGASSLLGVGLSSLLAGRARAKERFERSTSADSARDSTPRAKSVLFVFLFGGPSHLDTFDPKPDAPAEYRGEFGTIATRTPGLRLCEHLPRLAAQSDKFALVRTLASNPTFGDHRLAVHGLLGGIDELPAGATLAASRRDWPCWGSVLEYLRPRDDGLPNSVVLPGEVTDPATGTYPGQSGGFLGAKFDPYRFDRDPNRPDYRVDASLSLTAGMSISRLTAKRELLTEIDRQRTAVSAAAETVSFTGEQQAAFDVLTSGKLAGALALEHESPLLRDRYGRHLFGQSLLLARRLIEAGVPLVQANISYQALWDTHYNNFEALKGLIPPFDAAISALLEDMHAGGLLDETLVVVAGEFGRTPKIKQPDGSSPYFTKPGRDHWMNCFSGFFAGAGVRGGQAIGRSDAIGAFPVTRPYTHADIAATVYAALGIDPTMMIADLQGRPAQLNRGEPIAALYA